MKRIYFLLPLFFVCFFAQGQGFIHFPDSTYWKSRVVDYLQYYYNSAYFYNYFSGDTIIDGTNYKKIETEILYDSYNLNKRHAFVLYKGAFIHEDTLNNKVYIKRLDSLFDFQDTALIGTLCDTLLYDYNLELGDTLKGYLVNVSKCSNLDFFYFGHELKVTKIDTVFIAGKYRKKWEIGNNPYRFIIEGLGSSWGLATPIDGQHEFWFSYYKHNLLCIKDTTGVIYTNPIWAMKNDSLCDNIHVSTQGVKKTDSFIQIYPNPANNQITIRLNDYIPMPSKFKVAITNMLGQTILSNNYTSVNNEIIVDISQLPNNALYMIMLTHNEKNIFKTKFIKQ